MRTVKRTSSALLVVLCGCIAILVVCYYFFIVSANDKNTYGDSSNRLRTEFSRLSAEVEAKRQHLAELINPKQQLLLKQDPLKLSEPQHDQQQDQEYARGDQQGSVLSAPSKEVAATHSILFLSDSAFRSTKVSDLMLPYGGAEGGGSCSGDFGNDLVTRWRNSRIDVCSGTSSGIACYPIKQTRHAGVCDNLCVMHGVALDISVFADDRSTAAAVRQYVATKHMAQPYLKPATGTVRTRGTCNINHQHWDPKFYPGWNADWIPGAVRVAGNNEVSCPSSPSSVSKALLLQRDTFANFFHDSEDFVNAFLSLAILQWSLSETQLLLTDLHPRGPFWDIWNRVFSASNSPPLTSWDLRMKYLSSSRNPSPPYDLCYDELAIGIYGPAAPITVASWNTPCRRTALIRAYSDFVIRGLGLQTATHYANAEPLKLVVVTYMARRSYSAWPEVQHCNNTHSFFKCEYWQGFGARAIGRTLNNDMDFSRALQQLEKEKFRNGAIVEVRIVDYNKLNFDQQIRMDLETDIMIGPHGAGLMHNIFMRDRATLIEMHVDGSSNNRHFHNLAHWYGRKYVEVSSRNPVDIPHILSVVRREIESLDLDSY